MKLKNKYNDVVIGSGTEVEYKFQIINFMNMLYNVIKEDKEYGIHSNSNLRPWCYNLTVYIKYLENKTNISAFYDINLGIYSRINAIMINLEKGDGNNMGVIKRLCMSIWEDLLNELTNIFKLEYTINE